MNFNKFLDLQAVDNDGETDSEEDISEQKYPEFIEDNNTGRDEAIQLAALSREQMRSEEEHGSEEQRWQDFIDRANARATTLNVYRSEKQIQESDNHAGSGPGQSTKSTQSGEALLHSTGVPLPFEVDIARILNSSPSYTRWPWRRVRGRMDKWKRYAGDTGLITTVAGGGRKLWLALIPRLGSQEAPDTQSRIPQALVPRSALIARQARIAPGFNPNTFLWGGLRFSNEGLLLIDLSDIDTFFLTEPIPSATELEMFRSTSFLSSMEAKKIERRMAQSHLKLGDRVKVVSGPYFQLIGEITEMKEGEVTVYLPSQDIAEDMPTYTVRASFVVGDEVKVLDGPSQGFVGWIVAVSEDTLCVLDVKDSREVSVSKSVVEFHSSDHVVSLQPRGPNTEWARLAKERNPNDVYLEKRVMIIGHHQLKGYRGLIKSTTLDGYAFMQLESRLEKMIKVNLSDVVCMTDLDKHGESPAAEDLRGAPEVTEFERESAPEPESAPASERVPAPELAPAPAPVPVIRSNHPIRLAATTTAPKQSMLASATGLGGASPLTSAQPQSSTSAPTTQHPATHPSLRSTGQLFNDTDLHRCRLKLWVNDPSVESPYVEFLGTEFGFVKVRDKADFKLVAYELAHPLLPAARGDLVAPLYGEKKGAVLRVVQITGHSCTVRKLGIHRPSKKDPDHTFDISDLAQVYPPFRRSCANPV